MVKIVGVRSYSFDDRQTGAKVEGVSVYCTERMDEAAGGRGEEAYKLSFPGETWKGVFGSSEQLGGLVGKMVDFEYQRGGKRPVSYKLSK